MIFLYILLFFLAVICLLLFLNVTLKIEYKDRLILTLFLLGIPIDIFKLIHFFQKETKQHNAEIKTDKEEATKEKRPFLQTVSDFHSFLSAVLRAVSAAAHSLKRHLKIRIRSLTLSISSDDAAKTAMLYGELSGLIGALFGVCEEFTRFRADYENLNIAADFEHGKNTFSICLTLKIAPVFLITTYTNTRLAYMKDFLELGALQTKQEQAKKKGSVS